MQSEILAVGRPAPDVVLPATSGGVERLSDRRGRSVALIFYRGHWCPACRRHLAQLRNAYASISRLGADILAVSTESPDAPQASDHAQTLPFPLLSDDQGRLVRSLGLAVFDDDRERWIARPATVLIDRLGIIRFAHIGEHPRDRPALGSILLALEWMDENGSAEG
jgi:peroxiredoxin Q/BCP